MMFPTCPPRLNPNSPPTEKDLFYADPSSYARSIFEKNIYSHVVVQNTHVKWAILPVLIEHHYVLVSLHK